MASSRTTASSAPSESSSAVRVERELAAGTKQAEVTEAFLPLPRVHPEDEELVLPLKVRAANELVQRAYALLGWDHPVGRVQWVPIDQVQANDYNPNAVAHQEMKLLYTSIEQDGYTQPVVCIFDPEAHDGEGRYVIVDGFHRWTVMRRYADIRESTHGYLPVVVIDAPPADRMASTVRHNRARGKHSIAGMGSLVFSLLQEGMTDPEICTKVGLEPTELARLKHITGYSKLYADVEYTRPTLNETQIRAKGRYKAAHPDEDVPSDF